MNKELGKEFPPGPERMNFLADNCDKIEKKGYMKSYSPEKVQELKEDLAVKSIKISEVEAKKKAATLEFNAELKPLKEEQATILRGIKERAEFVDDEDCYKFVDQEEKTVGYYNGNGDLIESRPAYPDELQGTIFQMKRTGTDN